MSLPRNLVVVAQELSRECPIWAQRATEMGIAVSDIPACRRNLSRGSQVWKASSVPGRLNIVHKLPQLSGTPNPRQAGQPELGPRSLHCRGASPSRLQFPRAPCSGIGEAFRGNAGSIRNPGTEQDGVLSISASFLPWRWPSHEFTSGVRLAALASLITLGYCADPIPAGSAGSAGLPPSAAGPCTCRTHWPVRGLGRSARNGRRRGGR